MNNRILKEELTHHNKRSCTEAKLIGTQKSSDHHIESCTQLAIGLDNHSGEDGESTRAARPIPDRSGSRSGSRPIRVGRHDIERKATLASPTWSKNKCNEKKLRMEHSATWIVIE